MPPGNFRVLGEEILRQPMGKVNPSQFLEVPSLSRLGNNRLGLVSTTRVPDLWHIQNAVGIPPARRHNVHKEIAVLVVSLCSYRL